MRGAVTTTRIATTALVLLVAGCGARHPSSHTSDSTKHATATPTSRAVAFTRCMRSHGVSNYPDPSNANSGPGTDGLPKVNLQALGVSSSRVDAAEKACRPMLPNGAQLTRTTARSILSRLVRFADCVRSHGVKDWPDPSHTLASFPGAPPFGFDLRGIPSLEGGASGSFAPRINAVIGRCLRVLHLSSVQVPWGSWQR